MSAVLGAVLADPSPPVSADQARDLAQELFGVVGAAVALPGERDRNFRIEEPDGPQWVLKVVHPAESRGLTQMQGKVLLHLAEQDPELPVPRVRLTTGTGALQTIWHEAGQPEGRTVRMYSYLPGVPLLGRSSPALRASIGGFLGRLDNALDGFAHPHESHDLIWDAHKLGQIGDRLAAEAGPGAVKPRLLHFREHCEPALARLRAQVIHNDMNPHNVLTSRSDREDITGVIDFGDVIRAPVVQDVATAASYQVLGYGDPLDGPADVVRAYHAACPLRQEDLAVLFDLMMARLLLRDTIAHVRARNTPADRDYILRNSAQAKTALERLAGTTCESAQQRFREEIGGPGR